MNLERLFKSLSERWRPEDVAQEIRDLNILNASELDTLQPLLRWPRYSWMSTEFAQADGLTRQIEVAGILFPEIKVPGEDASVEEINAYIELLRSSIGDSQDYNFIFNRLDRKQRQAASVPYTGHRAYNKRYRMLGRLAQKLEKYRHNLLMRRLAQVAKSRLAFEITYEEFCADPNSAIYIAYLVARLNLRSQFIWGKQERAFDQVADMLLKRLDPSTAAWYAIARVDTNREIVQHLTTEEKGKLIATWYEVMTSGAKVLRDLTQRNDYNMTTMIVRRGNDSSSWNEAAGAYNKCRQGWISSIEASGLDTIFDAYLPGKVMRLMAADVAYMHRNYGSGDLDPDTRVWNELPKPWDVLLGDATCNRERIVEVCSRHGVKLSGWIESLSRYPAETKPTPELLYGVTIASPELARQLKQLGYFSGPSKGLRGFPSVAVERDYSGDVLKVSRVYEEDYSDLDLF